MISNIFQIFFSFDNGCWYIVAYRCGTVSVRFSLSIGIQGFASNAVMIFYIAAAAIFENSLRFLNRKSKTKSKPLNQEKTSIFKKITNM